MALKDTIRARRKELDMTLEEVARQIGTTRQTIYKYESGHITNIPKEKIEKIAAVLHTTPASLMGWEEEREALYLYGNIAPIPPMVKKPRLGAIACGVPILAEQNIEAYDAVPGEIACDFTLLCRGDSMAGAHIQDGDVVYIRQQEVVENGEIAAVLVGEEATLKRVYRDGDKLTLLAENPRFAPMVFTGEEMREVRILGKAVAYWSYIR